MVDHILRASLDRNLVVTIVYQKGSEITKRNIEVKSMEGSKIKAYCHLRQQARTFDLNCILAADYIRERARH